MNYFVIHSGCDLEERVMPLIEEWSAKFDRHRFVILNGTKEEWLGDAVSKIRQANKIIAIIGEKTNLSANVDLEIDEALKSNKEIYVYRLNDGYALNKKLNISNVEQHDGDVDGEIVLAHKKSKVVLCDRNYLENLLRKDNGAVWDDLCSSDYGNETKMLEQYKMFVQTSEELVRRKQTVNSFYITLNSVIISAIITVICATGELPLFMDKISVSFIITVFCGLIGIVVSFSWVSLINSYADLNASKMEIIQCIEERMAFNLYSTEWKILSTKLENRRYKSFSRKERMVAYLFAALYLLCMVAGCIVCFV